MAVTIGIRWRRPYYGGGWCCCPNFKMTNAFIKWLRAQPGVKAVDDSGCSVMFESYADPRKVQKLIDENLRNLMVKKLFGG